MRRSNEAPGKLMWGEVGRGIGKDRLANEWRGRAYLLSPGRGKIVVGTQNTDGVQDELSAVPERRDLCTGRV